MAESGVTEEVQCQVDDLVLGGQTQGLCSGHFDGNRMAPPGLDIEALIFVAHDVAMQLQGHVAGGVEQPWQVTVGRFDCFVLPQLLEPVLLQMARRTLELALGNEEVEVHHDPSTRIAVDELADDSALQHDDGDVDRTEQVEAASELASKEEVAHGRLPTTREECVEHLHRNLARQLVCCQQ